MKKEEVEHLASLSRIKLSDTEAESLEKDLSSIVDYVSKVSEIVADDADAAPQVGTVHNVFRSDEITNEPNEFSEDILAEMPATDGRYMKVKKILKVE